MSGPGGFDRLRPRTGGSPAGSAAPSPAVRGDAEGRRALFSEAPASTRPAFGALLLECSRCATTSVLGLRQAVRAAVPSLHLPLLRRYSSWMRCPACHRRTWVRLRVQL